ncbi:ABC transporter permease subunit [Brevundimonas nasdae]|uniref:ABC transporter permease subunit n=1 Tax=Brevundimonas nasdae TaxID=172043 RepID=A0ABX8TJ00_9CAUL|nr:ABC transporter permease subunit [Brevundimonas nasdae]QYC10984.1 ABC transporter permease subunit [Brevundimonas nasdae]QYC13771.1 ABC transporter permease subunit [Brevundimonas nasdae]
MLADAIRSETYRLSKNRTALFWSVLFIPIISVVLGVIAIIVAKAHEADLAGKLPPELLQRAPLNLAESLVKSAADFANPIVLLFILIGAATIYAGDYRWETWRLISARNTRPNLLTGKVVVVIGLTVLATLAGLLADIITHLVQALILSRSLSFSMDGAAFTDFVQLTLLSWARIIQFTMLALLAATVTRSLLAALFVPLVISVAQFFLPQMLMQMGVSPEGWVAPLLSPGLAADLLKALIHGGMEAAGLPPQAALKAVTGLALWIVGPFVAAVAYFNRQDLSKE